MKVSAHSTGWTILLAVGLTVGLSLAPIPERWRPLPSLATQPVPDTLTEVFWPARAARSAEALASAGPLPAPAATPPPAPSPAAAAPALPAGAEAPSSPAAEAAAAASLGALESKSVAELEALALQLGARHVEIEEGCLRPGPAGCERRALDPFFERIEALARGQSRAPVRVLHLGDSQIASDHITDLVRRRLERRFGSAGPGLLFVDRPTRGAGRKVRTGAASEGWEITKITDAKPEGMIGLTGVRFRAASAERTEFAAGKARTAEIFFATGSRSGLLEVKADKKVVGRVFTRFGDSEPASTTLRLPRGAERISVAARGGPVDVFGVALETGGPGVVYDTVGLPGASAETFLLADPKAFATQLGRREPALVVLMLGGNASYALSRGRTSLEEIRAGNAALLERVRAAAPRAACLFFGPMDAGVRTVGGALVARSQSAPVGKLLQSLALESGCAYWDPQAAMGGEGSFARWMQAGVFNEDLVHPLPRGADLLGHLFDFALERARQRRAAVAQAASPRISGPQSLSGTFGRLRALEAGKGERLAIVQLGASHTAGQMFTDRVRARLASLFGDGGRGFVAAGRPSARLRRSGVRRGLSGRWQVLDAHVAGVGDEWGLTGVRAQGGPRASWFLEYGGQPASGPGTLGLYYLETPGMGRMEVRIDGVPVARLPERAPTGREAKVARFAVEGSVHSLEVRNLGGGPIALFGAALDLDGPGVGYDALGLPGSTAALYGRFDRQALTAQLQARAAHLYVLFFGTNESAQPALDTEALREHNRALLATLRAASPGAECLIIGPTDRLARRPDGGAGPAPSIDRVESALRELAAEEGCAHWSARAAMGGPLSMVRWQSFDPPLGHPDGIHLTPAGYDALADAFVDQLLQASGAAGKEGGTSISTAYNSSPSSP